MYCTSIFSTLNRILVSDILHRLELVMKKVTIS
uniref:Uncharacterized protein n=1 Tax=Arundo donax TaxID=35708 RepID=A0A0A9A3U8_ARUDO